MPWTQMSSWILKTAKEIVLRIAKIYRPATNPSLRDHTSKLISQRSGMRSGCRRPTAISPKIINGGPGVRPAKAWAKLTILVFIPNKIITHRGGSMTQMIARIQPETITQAHFSKLNLLEANGSAACRRNSQKSPRQAWGRWKTNTPPLRIKRNR